MYLVESVQKDTKGEEFGSADVETIFVIVKGQTLIEKDDIGKVCLYSFVFFQVKRNEMSITKKNIFTRYFEFNLNH